MEENRLRLLRHDEIFQDRESAVDYINEMLKSQALYAEPAIVKYGQAQNPNIIIAIGSVGDGTQKSGNRIFIIDTAKIEESVQEVVEQVKDDAQVVEELKDKFTILINSCGLAEDGSYIKDINDDLLRNANSLNDAIKVLSYALQELDKITTITAKETNTIKLTATQDTNNGTVLTADAKISTYGELDPDFNDNIIVPMTDGLFAAVDLVYDENKGILTFTASGKREDGNVGVKIIEKNFKIGLHTKLQSITYNPDTEKFIIKMTDSDGNEVIERVPASGIITEWEVYNAPDSAILLTKERNKAGKDKLSADVILSSGNNNILKKSPTTGGLMVKGTADNIKYDTNLTVKDKLDLLASTDASNLDLAKAYTDTQVAIEKERATAAENAIQGQLDSEINRAKAAEKANADAIAIINGDNETQGSIKKALKDANAYTDAEKERATEAEQNLQKQLDILNGNEAVSGSVKESLKLAKQYTDEKVQAEKDRAMAAESEINKAIAIINGNEAEEGSVKNAIKKANDYTDSKIAESNTVINNRFEELENQIAADENRAKFTAEDTTTIDFTYKQDDTNGIVLTGDVKLSDSNGNILKAENGGLYASVTMDYNLKENAIYFYSSELDEPKKMVLSSGSLVSNAYYDASKKVIVLELENAAGETQHIEIPVADLISGWQVGRKPGSAVILTKEQVNGTDYLYADVDVSADKDNLLTKNNGVLKVSNSASNIIMSGTTSVKAYLEDLANTVNINKTEAKTYTDTQVQAEKDRAMLAEQNETNRAMGVETDLQKQITAEIERATKAEENETTRATNAENTLNAKIESNKQAIDVLNADKDVPGSYKHGDMLVTEQLTHLLNDETSRAQDAEKYLQEQIDKLNGTGSGSLADILQQAKDYTDNTFAPVPGLIEQAKQEAISTAAADATEKANQAKLEAINTAAQDATDKMNDAIETAADDATMKANQAKQEAIDAAAADATEKANQALEDAKDYADANDKYTTGATVNADNYTVTIKFKDSSLDYTFDLTPIINKAVADAVKQAMEGAAQNIQYQGVQSDSCIVTVDNSATPRTIKVDVFQIDNGLFA